MAKYVLADGESLRTVRCTIDTGTVIAAGDLVAIDTGLIIKAVAASTAVAFCPKGSASGETVCEVSVGNDFTLKGTLDAVFAVAYKGGEYDIEDTTQLIDLDASSTDVLKIDMSENAGTVGATTNVRVRINKPIF
ncbi:MAG TPA: hypothetical protein VMY59_02310 [Candidatus Thermoplasmatota archaeon]|nr:hypothetical protein [Candidatus Thermoplasmatota archaeon]